MFETQICRKTVSATSIKRFENFAEIRFSGLIADYCGNSGPNSFLGSDGVPITIVFETNGENAGMGFELEYRSFTGAKIQIFCTSFHYVMIPGAVFENVIPVYF